MPFPNGNLVSLCSDFTVNVWNTNGHYLMNTLTDAVNDYVWILAALTNGNLASCYNSDIKIWNTDTGGLVYSLTGHSDKIKSLVVLKNGYLASGSADNTINIWDVNTGILKRTLRGHSYAVTTLLSLPNGYLASRDYQGHIRIWNAITGVLKQSITSQTIFSVGVLQNGYLYAWSYSQIKIWNSHNGASVKNLTIPDFSGGRPAELQNGYLALGCDDNTIKIYNIDTGDLISTLTGHAYYILMLTILQNGNLASLSYESVKIWKTEDFITTSTLISTVSETPGK